MREFILPDNIKTAVRFYRCTGPHPRSWVPTTSARPNTILYEWGPIVAALLSGNPAAAAINYMYLEFANVAHGGDPVTIPGYDRSGGSDYYAGLAGDPTHDYLRVPIIAAVQSNSGALYPSNNAVTFYAQSQGFAGINGKPFSDVNNSVVYGAALVSAPVPGDVTRDLIFSRYYPPTDEQQPKLSTSQVGVTWFDAFQ